MSIKKDTSESWFTARNAARLKQILSTFTVSRAWRSQEQALCVAASLLGRLSKYFVDGFNLGAVVRRNQKSSSCRWSTDGRTLTQTVNYWKTALSRAFATQWHRTRDMVVGTSAGEGVPG
jgi:hypothetical protein